MRETVAELNRRASHAGMPKTESLRLTMIERVHKIEKYLLSTHFHDDHGRMGRELSQLMTHTGGPPQLCRPRQPKSPGGLRIRVEQLDAFSVYARCEAVHLICNRSTASVSRSKRSCDRGKFAGGRSSRPCHREDPATTLPRCPCLEIPSRIPVLRMMINTVNFDSWGIWFWVISTGQPLFESRMSDDKIGPVEATWSRITGHDAADPATFAAFKPAEWPS